MTSFPEPSIFALRAAGAALCAVAVLGYLFRKRSVRIITVIDGDTFMAVGVSGKKYKIRLHGVDCPELGQKLSYEAKDFVTEQVQGKWVEAKFRGRDKYRRHVASIHYDGHDLARELIVHGLGFPLSRRLKLASIGARLLHRGVWKVGQPKPWDSTSRTSTVSSLLNHSKRWRDMRRKQKEANYRRRKG